MGLVAQSVISATDTQGHWYVHGLSATDPCPRMSARCHNRGVSSHPQHVCVCGDNTTPRRIDGVAQLGPL